MLREALSVKLIDPRATSAAELERERSRQWKRELDGRAEREMALQKFSTDGAAGDQYIVDGYRARSDHEVTGVVLLPFANVAANAANYATLRLVRHRGDGLALSSATQVSALTTQINGWTNGVEIAIGVDGPNAQVRAGEWVLLHVLKTGAGVALPGFLFMLVHKRRQEWGR